MAYEKTTTIKVPFLNQQVGAGDIVERMTNAVGIKPCNKCKKRKQWLNERFQFIGRR